MSRHAGFRWRGGGSTVGTHSRLGSVPVLSGRTALWGRVVFLCIPLICIVVVTVPSVCCSVKLLLSRPTSFCLFLSILLCTVAGGGAAAWRFCCRRQPKPEQTNLPLVKAKPISNGGSTSGITYLRRGIKKTVVRWQLRERSETM